MTEMHTPKSQGSPTLAHWYDPGSTPLTITEGTGSTVYDDAGNAYLDFVSSLYCTNAGHDNDAIIEAMVEQARRVPYVSPSKRNDTREQLAEKLVEVGPDSLTDVTFSVTGSEANELAVQLARRAQNGSKVLTRWRSYHGSTYGAGSYTGEPVTRNAVESHAATTGAVKFLPPLTHNSPFAAETPEALAEAAANHVEFVIRNEGPDSVAAILIEPVAGSSGAYTAPPGYFERLRELCDRYDVLLIADEVITGFGRCGEMFAIAGEGIEPDMITFAKGITGAYVPLAGVMMRPEIAAVARTDGNNLGQTFAGHPVGCAAGLAAIDEYESHLIENVRSLTPLLADRVAALESAHDVIATTRGRGFHWGIVVEDPDTGEPFTTQRLDGRGPNPVEEVVATAKENGVLVSTGRPNNQLMLCPPLCTTAAEIEVAMETIDAAFSRVFD